MLNEISIEIIRKCPNLCVHCSSLSTRHCSEIISLKSFMQVVDDAKELGVKTICFSGGEPFLHPKLAKMLRYVYDHKINSYIYTSGVSLDEDGKYISIPEQLLIDVSPYVSKLIFNVEASSENTYNEIMGTKNCFSLFKQSVQRAVRNKLLAEAHFVPMKLNFHEIDNIIPFCESLGISKVSFLRLVTHGRAEQNMEKIALSDEETNFVISKLKNMKSTSSVDVRIGVPLSDSQEITKCEAATGKLNIKYDGCVYPCEVFKNHAIKLKEGIEIPNIHKDRLIEIYKNSKYLNSIRDYIQSFSCEASCENCAGQYLIKSQDEVGILDARSEYDPNENLVNYAVELSKIASSLVTRV